MRLVKLTNPELKKLLLLQERCVFTIDNEGSLTVYEGKVTNIDDIKAEFEKLETIKEFHSTDTIYSVSVRCKCSSSKPYEIELNVQDY
jgi:hypothetical protein